MKLTNLKNVRRYVRQAGQGMTEYIIIVAVIAIGSIGLYTFYGDILRNQTAAASKSLAGQSGKDVMKSAENTALAAQMDAAVGKTLENFGDVSTHK
ncbi:MAG: pilus assembly protein [Betaproteobacteria bacterium]|nr:pilus assembly protein [Betaproteobacteria bacterium]